MRILFIILLVCLCSVQAQASFSGCYARNAALVDQFFTIVNFASLLAAMTAVMMIFLFKVSKLGANSRYTLLYLLLSPILFVLFGHEINVSNNYYIHFGTMNPCSFRMNESGIILTIWFLTTAGLNILLFLKGKKKVGKEFDIYLNRIFFVLILFVILMGGYYHYYAPRWNL